MYCFVVLHYKNLEDTLECINKLNELDGEKKIIVVDNNSCSKEEKRLLKEKNIDLKILNENKGFAKANNIGINYAKEKYNPDFIIVINNDVFITQNNFLDIIDNTYKKYKFDMMGPYIESPSGESINPFPVIKNIDELDQEILRTKKLIKIYSSRILYMLLRLYTYIKSKADKKEKRENGKVLKEFASLHGCAIIFTKKYLNKYKYAFFNETFLFHEEEFLYRRVIEDKLISIYNPELKVFHKEGSTTKKLNKTKRLNKLFREKERLKSLKLLKAKY